MGCSERSSRKVIRAVAVDGSLQLLHGLHSLRISASSKHLRNGGLKGAQRWLLKRLACSSNGGLRVSRAFLNGA